MGFEPTNLAFKREKTVHASDRAATVQLSTMLWTNMGKWRYSSTIFDLGTRRRWVVSFTPRPIYPRWNRPHHPLDRRLVRSQSLPGRSGNQPGPSRPAACLCTDSAIPYIRTLFSYLPVLVYPHTLIPVISSNIQFYQRVLCWIRNWGTFMCKYLSKG
jgi:hypothetical protein